jgi:signal peptidase I
LKISSKIYSWIKLIGLALIIIGLSYQFLMIPAVVKGQSMFPTLENNNGIVVTKTTSIDRFDMIVFDAPDKDSKYVKRVIGVPGDRIEMIDDILYVNDKTYKEEYVNRDEEYDQMTENFSLEDVAGVTKVPEGHYFVLGDNRTHSKDSRRFGLISEDSIVGEVKFRFFPLRELAVKE